MKVHRVLIPDAERSLLPEASLEFRETAVIGASRGARRRTQRTAHDPPSSRSTFAFPRTEMNRMLPLLRGGLCGWGCDNSASPALPAVAPPPPAPAPSLPLVVGFLAGPDQDPGRGVHPGRGAVRRRYRSPFHLASPPDDSAPGCRRGRKRLAGRRGGGAASGRLRARLRKNPAGERRLAGRPPGSGRRCLRGAGEPAAPSLHRDGPREEPPGWGAGSERLYEIGDRSRDSRWSRSCSGVELPATAPHRSRSPTSCQRALYVTDVTVVSGTPGFPRVDPDISSRIRSIRTEPRGAGFFHELPASAMNCRLPPRTAGFRHELPVQWKLGSLERETFAFDPVPPPDAAPLSSVSRPPAGSLPKASLFPRRHPPSARCPFPAPALREGSGGAVCRRVA